MLLQFQVNSEGIQPSINSQSMSLDIEQSSLCYPVGPCWLDTLNFYEEFLWLGNSPGI